MKVAKAETEFKPVTVTFETQKEMLAIRWALLMCLSRCHPGERDTSLNSHRDIVKELHEKLSDNLN